MKALYFDNSLPKIIMLQIASKLYRDAAFTVISPTRYAEVPEPDIPNPRWLKVRNRSAGLCGTDIHLIFMEMDPKIFPAATPGIARKYLGHELVGEVMEVGAEVDDFRKGDRVCLRIDWPSCYQMEIDPPCPQCRKGAYMQCENIGMRELPLIDVGGGFSPFMVMHRTQPFRIPPDLSDDEGLLIEPVAVAVHGVLKHPPEKNDRVLVVGCGTIGLLTIAVAAAMQPDVEITAVARYPFQAVMARRMGAHEVIVGEKNPFRRIADLTGAKYFEGYFGNRILLGGFDIVYDSVGNDGSITNALRWTRSGGGVVILGINLKPGRLDYTPIWHQELRVTGTNCHVLDEENKSSFEIAAKLLSEKRISIDGIITHRFPMNRYREAIKTFLDKARHEAVKIVLDHEA